MTRRHALAALLLLVIALLGCKKLGLGGEDEGGGGSKSAPEITVAHPKIPKTTVPVSSAHTYSSTKTFTAPNTPMKTARVVTVFLSNTPLDPSRGPATMGKPPAKKGDVKVQLALIGKEGTDGGDTQAPPEAGVYDTKADKFMKLESVAIHGHDGSAAFKDFLDRDALAGKVEVTNVTAQTFDGTVALTAGASSIQGSFTATIGKGTPAKP